jgi:K(+)-stimulated pyrophosphate-energized sodium pump
MTTIPAASLVLIPLAGALALVFAYLKSRWIARQDPGNERMREIGAAVREGAMAFLIREYKVLAYFVSAIALLLLGIYWNQGKAMIAAAFVVGALCSAISGFFGMRVATAANHRTTQAATIGLPQALQVAFSGGTVMGMCVVGLGLLGLGVLYLALGGWNVEAAELGDLMAQITGFSMGASSIALFARVGGGIYTKAADVGADLVGKVEAGIPEDDPRNPATIADNVGDNVGDVAGMGADLFESYVGAIVAAMVLAATRFSEYQVEMAVLPLLLAALGIVCSIAGTFVVRTREGGNPQNALNLGTFGAGGLMVLLSYLVIHWVVPAGGVPRVSLDAAGAAAPLGANQIFLAAVTGLAAGILIGLLTELFTAEARRPAQEIAKASVTGAATNIIAGLGLGMYSTMPPCIVLGAGMIIAHQAAGLYGIAIAGLGMLATTGIQLAVDAYGPIADNAGGCAEMAGLPKEVRSRTDKLDAVGNTTAAIGKGFAIGSAALTALALFAAFQETAGIRSIDISKPQVTAGLLLGTMLPFLFSSLAMKAVGKAAFQMIEEVRRQFSEIPGLREGKAKPNYARCVDISTAAAIKEMALPGTIAIVVPVIFWALHLIGLPGMPETLAGLLAGVTTSGVVLAIFMSNAGGAWDNAKKHIEGGALGGKGSEAHKAAVVGDTVGDPFKDTAGPSINILIKLMSIVSLVLAPLMKTAAS